MDSFRNLGIAPEILKVITEEGFTEPSQIQADSIPLILDGKDVIGASATGSGKTLAFGAGLLPKMTPKAGVQALVLTPTRELAEQVAKSLRKFGRHLPLHIEPIYGGVAISPQLRAIHHAEVIVGTPGRILDHLQRGSLSLDKIKVFVLDEADVMFDMGFIADVEKILRQTQKNRQTLLFSATMSKDVVHIAQKHMVNPVKVDAEVLVDSSKLEQVYYNVADKQKFSLLVHLLKSEQGGLVMVFCNTQRTTDFVAHNLKNNGIEAEAIHGGLSQAKRNSILHHFHSAKVFVLVCTDVAARGLDIKGVSHVYNFDIPKDSKQYVHRIGRTARAGKEGKALSLLADRDHENFSRVLRDNPVKIIKQELPEFERASVRVPEQRREFHHGRGGHGGNRLGRHFRNDRRDGDRRDDSRGGGRFGGSRHGGPRQHGERRNDHSGPRRKGYHEE